MQTTYQFESCNSLKYAIHFHILTMEITVDLSQYNKFNIIVISSIIQRISLCFKSFEVFYIFQIKIRHFFKIIIKEKLTVNIIRTITILSYVLVKTLSSWENMLYQ